MVGEPKSKDFFCEEIQVYKLYHIFSEGNLDRLIIFQKIGRELGFSASKAANLYRRAVRLHKTKPEFFEEEK